MRRLLIIFALLVPLTAFALDPAPYDIIMQAGEDYSLQLALKDSTGTALNLTGYSYKSQFRSAAAPAGAILANYSCKFSSMTTGRIVVKLSRAQTTALSGKSGVWDLQQTNSSGQVSYILKGTAVVSPSVTR